MQAVAESVSPSRGHLSILGQQGSYILDDDAHDGGRI